MCLVKSEWPPNKRYIITVEESFLDVGGNIRSRGEFGVTSYIDAVQRYLTIVAIAESGAVDSEAMGRHGECFYRASSTQAVD